MSCRNAGDDKRHARRAVVEGGLCHTCHYARKRHRRATGRISAVRRLYGLSGDDLEALRVAQRGRCWICHRRIGVVKAGAVDHDHGCGFCAGRGCRRCVRGLLCSTCNRWLGHIGDDPAGGVRAAMYLIDPPARKVL